MARRQASAERYFLMVLYIKCCKYDWTLGDGKGIEASIASCKAILRTITPSVLKDNDK
jgi:hypothetical protein